MAAMTPRACSEPWQQPKRSGLALALRETSAMNVSTPRDHSPLAPTTSPYTWRRPTVSGICFASKALVFSQDFRRHLVQSPTQGGASFQRKVLGREATKKVRCFTSRTLRAYARCVGGQQGWWKRRRCCPAETVFSPHFFPTSSSSRSMALFEVRPIQINVSLPVTYSSSSSSCGVSFTLAALNRLAPGLGCRGAAARATRARPPAHSAKAATTIEVTAARPC
mmetsp:Transcript_4926/g.9395  ORF Transcript_4926/g.9395 Transcript_4926/m.9395 type:complete len:223 (+) Transcript_4926:1-669(+)